MLISINPYFALEGDDSVPSPVLPRFMILRLLFAGAVRTFSHLGQIRSDQIDHDLDHPVPHLPL